MQEDTVQEGINVIKIAAIMGTLFGFLDIGFKILGAFRERLSVHGNWNIIGIDILLCLASFVCFLVAINEIKKHSGAKDLVINFFVIVFIVGVMEIGIGFAIKEAGKINILGISFIIKEVGNIDTLSLVILLCIFICVIFIPLKNLHYELSRVTFQKAFIYAFWCLIVGILCLPFLLPYAKESDNFLFVVISIALVLMIINSYIVAWSSLKKFLMKLLVIQGNIKVMRAI